MIDHFCPCVHRTRTIPAGDGHSVVCCELLDDALGWSHGSSESLCVRCAGHHGFASDPVRRETEWRERPKPPTVDGSDPLSVEFRLMVLHPLRVGLSDTFLQKMLNTDRSGAIEKAKRLGVPADDILKALIHGVRKQGVDPSVALSLADEHELFE